VNSAAGSKSARSPSVAFPSSPRGLVDHEFRKQKLLHSLFQEADALASRKCLKLRTALIKQVKEQCGINAPHEKKEAFAEGRIERDMKWFNAGGRDEEQHLRDLVRQLQRNERQRRQKMMQNQ